MAANDPGYCRSCDVFGHEDSCWMCGRTYIVRTRPEWRSTHVFKHSLNAQTIHGVTVMAEEVTAL